jgi:type I restriction enzyme, S subunit
MSSAQVPEGYKKTDVGVIPEDWKVKRLIDVVDYVDYRGKTPPKQDSGVFLVTAKNIKNGFIDYEISKEYVSEAEYDKIMSRGKPKIGDVVITTEAPLGNVAAVDNENIALAQRVIKYRSKGETLKQDYLKYYLLFEKFQRILQDNSSGSTAQGIKGSVLHTLPIIIPTEIEQQTIAQALSDVDALIASLDKLIAKQRQLKTAAMQQLLTGKMRLPGFGESKGYKQTEVGLIPEDWDAAQLGDIAEVIMGQSPKGSSYNRDRNGLALINGPTEFTDKYPIKVQWTTEPSKLCKSGDLLLCVRGSSTGRMNVANDEFCIGRGVAAIRANVKATTEYLTYQVYLAIEELLSLSTGSTFPSVDGKTIKSIFIPCPEQQEQREIATILSDMDTAITTLEQRRAKTQAIKQGMMQELLTGRTRLV